MTSRSIKIRISFALVLASICLVAFGIANYSSTKASSQVPVVQATSVIQPASATPSPTPTLVNATPETAPALLIAQTKSTPIPTVIPISPTSTRTATPVTPIKPTAARTAAPTQTAAPRATPTKSNNTTVTKTEIRKNSGQFNLLVNAQTMIVRGMNYNVNYTSLPEDMQLKMHRRDFKIMRDAGVNAIVGWGIYDDTTLKVAQEFGIGVIMPFELDPNGAYENQDYRNQLKSDFRDYINRYKNYPAVWGWNPGGDELLYRMDTEQHRTPDKLQIAADLELDMAMLARGVDPNHIIVIKEPRDWYIKYLGASLQKAKTQAGYQDLSTLLVYGVNVYGHTDDIQLALANAKITLTGQLGIAMLVTEFGPFNSSYNQRATNYAAIWDVVAKNSTLGGMAYVLCPDQPNPQVKNPYDPLTLLPSEYSLVDMNGNPIDGALAALSNKWRAPNPPTPTRTLTPTR